MDPLTDPRAFDRAAVLPERADLLCRAVPGEDGEIVRSTTTTNGTPVDAVTFRILEGVLAGRHAALLIWPSRRPDEVPYAVEALGPDRASYPERLRDQTFVAALETGPFGELEVRRLIATAPDTALVESLDPAIVDVPADLLPPPPPTPPPIHVRPLASGAEIEEAAQLLREASVLAVDIETACTRLPPERREERAAFEPVNGTVRLIQIAGHAADGALVTVIVDCWTHDPGPLLRVLAEAERVIAHNARFEQSWLAFRWDLELPGIFDTCAWWMVIARHLERAGFEHGLPDARLSTLAQRFCGIELDKSFQTSDWSQEELSAGQLEYAGIDAAVLLPLATLLERIGNELGCDAQARAASLAGARRALAAGRRSARLDEDESTTAGEQLVAARDIGELDQAAARLRRTVLGAASRERLGRLYRERRAALSAEV